MWNRNPLSVHILTVSDCHFLQSLRHLFVDADIGVPEFVERYHRDIIGRAITPPTTIEVVMLHGATVRSREQMAGDLAKAAAFTEEAFSEIIKAK